MCDLCFLLHVEAEAAVALNCFLRAVICSACTRSGMKLDGEVNPALNITAVREAMILM